MIIGIDVKELSKGHAGIAVYIESMLDWFHKLDADNQYILISNRDFQMKPNWSRCKKVLYNATITGSIGVCFQLRKIIKDYNIEVFWGPEHCIPLNNVGCKRVVTIHDIAVILNPSWGTVYNSILQKFMVKNSICKANQIIAISNSTKNDLVKLFNIDPIKVSVIYNGDSPYNYKRRNFSDEKIEQIKNKYGVGENFFLYCGTIEPRKNIISIIKAFELFKSNNLNNRVQLVLCGGLGWKYDSILACIDQSDFKKDIIRTGFITEEEKEFFYTFAKALVFPSFYEGLGLPVIEAMSCGTPVITANNSSLPEVGGNAALYVDPADNIEQLKNYMQVMDNLTEQQLNDLRKKSTSQAKKFSRKTCAEQILSVFEKVALNNE